VGTERYFWTPPKRWTVSETLKEGRVFTWWVQRPRKLWKSETVNARRGLPLPSYGGPWVSPRKIFKNIGTNLCNLVHFLAKMRILNRLRPVILFGCQFTHYTVNSSQSSRLSVHSSPRVDCEKLVSDLITTKLTSWAHIICVIWHYIVLYGTSTSNFYKLQMVQNALARTITRSSRSVPTSQLLSNLHWLPIHKIINFKVATLTYKILTTHQPAYLHNLISYHQPMSFSPFIL